MRAAIFAVASALVAAILLFAATGTRTAEHEPGDPASRLVRVTATTNFIADLAQQVGGRRVEVRALMGPGVDPHLYRASAGDVRALREADLIVYGGLQLEGKMEELLRRLGEHQPVVAVTRELPRQRLLGSGPEPDPHVWFDVRLWQEAVHAVRDELQRVDPRHADVYAANARAYLAELDRLDQYARERMSTVPERQRVLVTSHDAFAYFGRAYGLEVAPIQGISTAAEVTTADIRRVADLLAERGVDAVFVESSVPRQTIDAVVAAAGARGQSVRVGGELYADAAGDTGTPEATYVGMVRANVDRIVEGLR